MVRFGALFVVEVVDIYSDVRLDLAMFEHVSGRPSCSVFTDESFFKTSCHSNMHKETMRRPLLTAWPTWPSTCLKLTSLRHFFSWCSYSCLFHGSCALVLMSRSTCFRVARESQALIPGLRQVQAGGSHRWQVCPSTVILSCSWTMPTVISFSRSWSSAPLPRVCRCWTWRPPAP